MFRKRFPQKRDPGQQAHSHKPVPEKQFLAEDRPDRQMGSKHPARSEETGEMILPTTEQRSFLKKRASKHRRQRNREEVARQQRRSV